MWEQVTVGHSGDAVFRRPGEYRKHTAHAELEAATLEWLRRQGLPAAEVIDVGPDVLVTKAIDGRTGADPWPRDLRMRVVDAIADVTHAMHALRADDCPFDRSLAVAVAEARKSSPAELSSLEPQIRAMTTRELPTVTHGDWCLPNVVLDPGTLDVVGLIDTARTGRSDRYTDLALMNQSLRSAELNPQYGPEFATRFLARCGHVALDDDKLAFYRLLDTLW